MSFKPYLTWQKKEAESGCFYSSICSAEDEAKVRIAVGETVEKSMVFLNENINDDSMFLLFEWSKPFCTLKITVTDQYKNLDSKIVVECVFKGLVASTQDQGQTDMSCEALDENIHYWIKDYLTTCDAFFQYSLVALYHSDERAKTVLL